MRTREEIESNENKVLAPYAMHSRDCVGREFAEPLSSNRTCYQRDRDRIVHSEAFRKLEYKTQVFVIFEGDYYRTRLTHTIEVAQIARTIGRNLGLNEDLIEAIALAHDLGHSPFGHAGETALNDIMKEVGLGFDHNFRSFEIVTRLEKRYPQFDGLNLTEDVLVGILKHETDYDHHGPTGRFKDKGPTLEAKVVDIADSLAYLSHDIDDGITSGCITPEDLKESILWQEACRSLPVTVGQDNKEMFKYQIVRALIDRQVSDLLNASEKKLIQLNFLSSQDIKDYNLKYIDNPVINFSDGIKTQRDYLQKLVEEKFYFHYRILGMTAQAQRVIQTLFETYLNNPKQLPYSIYPRDKKFDKKEKHEIICNYIASMTDRMALNEYRKIFEPYQKI
ncbi:MAG: deoxyguanosinetriphosphate triphosphohydrolase [Candidatus Omnitrophica bacterium]|nr:deoxyguanosinetriphosphate triphosphohydrolase [Candidatus Omnitrophota bacterium]